MMATAHDRPAASQRRMRPIVAVANLRVEFDTDEAPVVGVDDVGFAVRPGETLCVVGESGSGKSVTSLALMRLVEFGGGRIAARPPRIHARRRRDDRPRQGRRRDACVSIRGDEIGMIFQEPMTSLNPVFTIGRQLDGRPRAHRACPARRRARGRSSFCAKCASPNRSGACDNIRTNSRAACASAS